MRLLHHQLIGLNTLIIMEIIKEKELKLPEEIKVDEVLTLLGRKQKKNRKEFKKYLIAPDLVRDIYVEMPSGIPDLYDFKGHNFSALQHFIVPKNNGFRGYNWDEDESLGIREEIGDIIMSIFSINVKYDPTVEEYGFKPEIMKKSPMNELINKRKKEIDLDDFTFPTAAEVGGYYGDKVAKNKKFSIITRVKAAGFALHFVMDACCAHHVLGYLLKGHTDWEKNLELNWQSIFGNLKDQKRINEKLEEIANKVIEYFNEKPELSKATSVKEVIEKNAKFIQNWLNEDSNKELALKGIITRKQTKKICIRAIASCIVALSIMFK